INKMSQNLYKPQELSLLLLFDRSTKYIIPLYQRNFAWGKKEIEQLMQDIIDKSENENSKYYIGSLVVDEKEKDTFEIIDGQQRHTTLTMINAYLNKDSYKSSNLFYEARPEVKKYLDSLFRGKIDDILDDSINKIKEGYDTIKSFFDSNKDLRGKQIDQD